MHLEPREILRILGVVVFTLGMICVPVGFGANPKRDSSSYFLNLTDAGQFFDLALIFLLLGAVILLVSFLRVPFRRARSTTKESRSKASESQ